MFFDEAKISFFLCSEELMVSLRDTLKSVKDVLHLLKVFHLLSFMFILEMYNIDGNLFFSQFYSVVWLNLYSKWKRSNNLERETVRNLNKFIV